MELLEKTPSCYSILSHSFRWLPSGLFETGKRTTPSALSTSHHTHSKLHAWEVICVNDDILPARLRLPILGAIAKIIRHWPVFWASFAVVLVTWGLVPTQAGIFSVQTVTRTTNPTFDVSTYSMPFEKQATSLTFRYAQSTYGIVTANETTPPYMARNFTLRPFRPRDSEASISQLGRYTAPTTMYSLDLDCEDVTHRADNSTTINYISNGGCNITDLGLDGNLTMGKDRGYTDIGTIKQYTGMYIGYNNAGGADYYLSTMCPKSENGTFYAAFQKNKVKP
jgi:hypothetical protein